MKDEIKSTITKAPLNMNNFSLSEWSRGELFWNICSTTACALVFISDVPILYTVWPEYIKAHLCNLFHLFHSYQHVHINLHKLHPICCKKVRSINPVLLLDSNGRSFATDLVSNIGRKNVWSNHILLVNVINVQKDQCFYVMQKKETFINSTLG